MSDDAIGTWGRADSSTAYGRLFAPKSRTTRRFSTDHPHESPLGSTSVLENPPPLRSDQSRGRVLAPRFHGALGLMGFPIHSPTRCGLCGMVAPATQRIALRGPAFCQTFPRHGEFPTIPRGGLIHEGLDGPRALIRIPSARGRRTDVLNAVVSECPRHDVATSAERSPKPMRLRFAGIRWRAQQVQFVRAPICCRAVIGTELQYAPPAQRKNPIISRSPPSLFERASPRRTPSGSNTPRSTTSKVRRFRALLRAPRRGRDDSGTVANGRSTGASPSHAR